jgi:hypothetical protein
LHGIQAKPSKQADSLAVLRAPGGLSLMMLHLWVKRVADERRRAGVESGLEFKAPTPASRLRSKYSFVCGFAQR